METDESAGRVESGSVERRIEQPSNGIPVLCLGLVASIAGLGAAVSGLVLLDAGDSLGGTVFGFAVLLGIAAVVSLRSLTMVRPNEAKMLLLFGDYRGTIRRPGLWAVHPLTTREPISTRVHNFESGQLKVNDSRGNPVEIAAVVSWRVRNTAQAAFDVEDHKSYVEVQSETAIRHLASSHPYDFPGEDEEPDVTTLRGSADVVSDELRLELSSRLETAGLEVLEARLSHLAYAPEIAGAMLQRQQADAILAARRRIVDGAVGMVQMALERLDAGGMLELDETRKAAMVSNLLVVLCGERAVSPVIHTGAD